MRRHFARSLIFSGVVLSMAIASVAARGQEETPRDRSEPSGNRRPSDGIPFGAGLLRPQDRAALLQRFDADGNGMLEPQERQEMARVLGTQGLDREGLIKRFDTDGDGQLSDAERRAVAQAIRRRAAEGGTPARGSGRGAGRGPEGPQISEIVDTSNLVARFDANGDGRLDAEERAQIRRVLDRRDRR